MKRIPLLLITIAFVCSLMSGCVTYPDYGRLVIDDANVRVKVAFSDNDRRLIHNYYKKKHKKMRRGPRKKDRLPPGLQKQLAGRGKLPPGLQGRYLPYDLERRLSRLPRRYVRQRIGEDIVLIEVTTRVIVDIIYTGY